MNAVKKTIGIYYDNSIEKIKKFWKNKYDKKLNEIMDIYPYNDDELEKTVDRFLKKYKISKSHLVYDDCQSIKFQGYFYSINQMTVNDNPTLEHIKYYVLKIIRIFIICILNIYDQTRQICRFNNLKRTDCSYI